MGKPIPGILGGDAPQSASDGFDKCGLGPRLGAAQGGFELAPHLFNGIELRRVGWQEEDLGSGASDQRESRFAFMRAEVVHDDHIALAQGWAQNTAHIRPENLSIGGPFNGHTGGGAVQAHRADHGGGLPAAVGGFAMHALSARSAPAQPGQVGLGARFVEKDQPGGIEAALAPPPRPAGPRDVGAVLLAGPERLFLYVSPIFASA
jgi:hypothetical protein